MKGHARAQREGPNGRIGRRGPFGCQIRDNCPRLVLTDQAGIEKLRQRIEPFRRNRVERLRAPIAQFMGQAQGFGCKGRGAEKGKKGCRKA